MNKEELKKKIYREYIIKQNEMIKLKRNFMLFHHIFCCMVTKKRDENYIKEKLEKLEIYFTYNNDIALFEDIDISRIMNMYNDFIEQYKIFEEDPSLDFTDLENNKLVILNILETYFAYIGKKANNKKSQEFYKLSINRFSQFIPKSKMKKIFDSYIHNFNYNLAIIGILGLVMILLFIAFLYGLTYATAYLSKFSFINIAGKEDFISILIIYIAFVASLFLGLFICIKFDKKIQKYLLPKKGFAFERSLTEGENFVSRASLGISVATFIFSILITLINITWNFM